jgi:DNA polymerase III subunit delta'
MNWNMLGHEWAVNLLKEHVARGQVRHAYLFTGPDQVGRRTLALRLAQAVNCPQPISPGEPCGACRTCLQIERMQHPDLSIIQAERRGGTLKVELVRELQRSLSLAPYEAKYRITLLLHFEEANASAANALLKTLEEPASKVILILTAESAEILLPTIVSRCELLRLRPLPIGQVNQGLQSGWGIPPEQASLLAAISDGRPGYAVHLYQHPEILEQRTHWLDQHASLLNTSRVERFRFAEASAKDKEMCRAMLFVWLSFWRDVLICAAGAAAPPANLDRNDQIITTAGQIGSERTLKMVGALESTIQRLDQNINSRLALEVLLLDLPAVRILPETE